MRIDKFISNLWFWSRKQVWIFIKNGEICVNQEIIFDKDFEIHFWDKIQIWEEEIEYKEFIYMILNKPSWYVCSKKQEAGHKSYLDLLITCPYYMIVDIVGRLDFDTTGLVFLTNNGLLTHKIIHPKKEKAKEVWKSEAGYIFKKYYVQSEKSFSQKDIQKLQNWVKIDSIVTKPSKVEVISENEIYLSICEWKFHQIKKMLEEIGNKVVQLKRISIGNIHLWNLKLWDWRYLTEDEIQTLHSLISQ